MQRAICLLVFILAGSLYAGSCHAQAADCATSVMYLQATTSTPARVTGAPGEHLTLLPVHPQAPNDYQIEPNPPMYLVTGDSVDEIATCGKYAFVRYQRHGKVSTGWVSRVRLKITGAPHPRPLDTVAQVCEAANRIVNAAKTPFALHTLHAQVIPTSLQKWTAKQAAEAGNPPTDMVRILSGGHVLNVVSVPDGGSCGSNYMQVWPDHGTKPLADTMPDYSDGGYMGDTQEMVEVLGHPLVMEFIQNFPSSFTLAALDKHGKQTKLCSIKREYAAPSSYLAHSRGAVCRAVVTGQARPITMRKVDVNQFRYPAKSNWNTPALRSMWMARSRVDLFNDGKLRKVGLIRNEYDSGAGCGYASILILPIILNAQGIADIAAPVNQRLMRLINGDTKLDIDNPSYPSSGMLVTVSGHVYYLMYVQSELPKDPVPTNGLQDVMELTTAGAKKVCSYQPYVYRVQPMTGLRKGTEAIN